jgi:hypothetical protein
MLWGVVTYTKVGGCPREASSSMSNIRPSQDGWPKADEAEQKEEERRCREVIKAPGREQNTNRPCVIPFPVPVSCPPHLSTKYRPAVRRYNAVGRGVGTMAVLKRSHPGAGPRYSQLRRPRQTFKPSRSPTRLPQLLMPLGWVA